MASDRDRNSIHINGNAQGPVVAGDRNHVEIHHAATDESPGDAADSTQRNTAHEYGTVYAVHDGDMHIHQRDR
ncbi:hypothetical protein D5S18_26970 [Nocardia panacis]|uniref:Uncharacterized protein n=1 Tax=Nocardia panacis TaxID=2340916 RepID=A0A3A4K0M9_9NOCA|nr:hypothetical protein [Nocardia panacis]RJO70833.1 hypothetical protein D5S18_26970 [Nocardia panacis]